ncbi:hypothetical protein POM88_037620 [Heracleum sosnowskyi]|uniref:Ubiquitin-like protease family profile domain-containing protein n=1 Tax=Heracleum sosnowskyi TaxID=360622 RepID=A0AAD8HRG7_9APIA|nr:hypothetical protein POM88_037620 [Heracleum sosnowskyi]
MPNAVWCDSATLLRDRYVFVGNMIAMLYLIFDLDTQKWASPLPESTLSSSFPYGSLCVDDSLYYLTGFGTWKYGTDYEANTNWIDQVDEDDDVGSIEKNKNAIRQEKVKDKEKEKAVESTGVSSKQLGYPLPQDVSHDGVLELVRVAVMLDRVTDLEIEMGPFWDGGPWTEHINKENVLEVPNEQWLSASTLALYIRYLCDQKFRRIYKRGIHLPNLAKFMLGYVDKEHLLFVPYNVSEHWVLVAINTRTENIYFMDPAPKATIVKYKNLKSLVETALKSFRTEDSSEDGI